MQTIAQRLELAKAQAKKTGKPAGFVVRMDRPEKPPTINHFCALLAATLAKGRAHK